MRYVEKQLRTIVTCLTILIAVAVGFFGYSIYRQVQISSCVHNAAGSSTLLGGGVGVGDITACMATH